MSLDTMKRVIVEAQSLGAESIVVIGGGEPTMYPKFTKLVEFIARQELIPVIITNGLKCSREMTQFLYDHNASVLCKLDSLDENIQDVLSGKPETFKRIRQGIDNLSDTGFACCKDNEMRCGLSFVVTRLNYTGIPQLWRFCRDMNLYPNLEALVPRGRAHEEIDKLEISALELSNLKQELRTIDVEHYGCDWVPHTPLPGHGCLQLMYSLYITSMGNIRPCADIDIDGLGLNVKNISLANVLENEFIRMARGIEFRLEGRCSDCEHSMVCIGCRGIAFTVGMIEGKSPLQALSREDPTCLK
jgi:radical SAM protein with 4Fe4S-binding SPASM domain